MLNKKLFKTLSLVLAIAVAVSATGCNSTTTDIESDITNEGSTPIVETDVAESDADEVVSNEEMSNTSDGEHVVEADGQTVEYSGVSITKTGDSDLGDEADFYGDNSAVFATNGAVLSLSNAIIDTDGTHANAIFSYGEGTTVNVSDSEITTSGNCSGGIMTTGGGTMNATNLTVHTTGDSSAAIRSDRGGGTVTVNGGSYMTDGIGSPVIYSTADITVNDARLESTAAQGVVVEGQNSVTLNNVELIADNNTKNGDNSDYYQAVMIYQSMSGDADEGLASFAMTDGSLTNANGDIFFVNNTVANITLEHVTIVNQDDEGVLLRAEAAGWGTEGSNGGQVNLYLVNQTVEGDVVVDNVSALNMYITSGSSYEGAVNGDNDGEVYVEIESGSTWTLTSDSYVTSLTCAEGSINLNGYKLYVNGLEYSDGTSSEGTAITFTTVSSSFAGDDRSEGEPPEMPNGNASPGSEGNEPPEMPDGNGPVGNGNEPPVRPEDI